MKQHIRIGTRGSKLALTQTNMVIDALKAAHPGLEAETVIITTSGDWKPEQGETRLSEAQGGKGLFAREIESAILAGTVDCGVHSLKDMPSFLPEGLVIGHVLEREDPRDALLTNGPASLDALPEGAVVGTSSLRRQALILARRPDLKIVPLRGNVPTRIEKLRQGQVDAAILAYAGLRRLGLEHEVTDLFSAADMLPAAAQGVIGIECRQDDRETHALLDAIHCRATGLCAIVERLILQILDGSCRTPIGAYATLDEDGKTMSVQALVASADGEALYEDEGSATVETPADAEALGRAVGERLKACVPPELLA